MNIADASFQLQSPLTLPQDEVQLWRVDLEAVAAGEQRWQQILSADEQVRASRFHFPRDRQYFTAGRALLRTIMAGYLGCAPGDLSFVYSEKDKPSLGTPYDNGIAFNISHSGGVALLAFTCGRELGVDVEKIRQDFEVEAIARRFFSVHERDQLSAVATGLGFEAFFRCWTRKEAYIKAIGTGLSLPLHQFDVSIKTGDQDALLATRPDGSEAGRWSLREVPAGPGYVAALCVRGTGWHLKDWSGELPLLAPGR